MAGGQRVPKGTEFDPTEILTVSPADGPGGRWKYRTVERVELRGGVTVFRCIHPDCQRLAFKSGPAAAMHRGAAHPGESPRAEERNRRRSARLVDEPAEKPKLPASNEILPAKPRRGRPPADPELAEEAFLDAAAPSVALSVTDFIDRLIASRGRAMSEAKGAKAEADRMRTSLRAVQHHVTEIVKILQELR